MGDTLTSQIAATPRIAVTRGQPSPAELAAVLAVLFAAAQVPAATPAGPRRPSGWTRGSRLRSALPPSGPRAWHASALPC
jgi:hypothetical protein